MKILIGCLFFSNLTGSELYVYELAKGLVENGFDVSVVASNIGGEVTNMASKIGVKVYNFQTLPKNIKFDIIHGSLSILNKESTIKYINIIDNVKFCKYAMDGYMRNS